MTLDKSLTRLKAAVCFTRRKIMTDRKSLSKKIRFEIFKRDKFTCQYCGKQPPDIVLVVDHINPVALGGNNDEMNLITSCESCNQGKGAKALEPVPNRPDADLEWLEMQQEIAELRRYQLLKKRRDEIITEIIEELSDLWWEIVDAKYAPSDMIFRNWLRFATPDQIEDSIRILATKDFLNNMSDRIKYCSGILHNLTKDE